ncbi:uncharacterized protein LOC128640180 [Bombina bombina]|uniref:uncharacterized protein LOC128640180 n=1 Tax=Bombina bombina TaxID=8345 RepID=UPI00235A8CCE|nr:uncharacterized protein LOC128640180 [Bombina bombina]XP_053548531.1 uncharacterized protein LOC128640180 [Bombina bombina]
MVLQLDKNCEEAVKEMHTCQIMRLMEQGFTQEQSMYLLEEYESVTAVLESAIAAEVLAGNMRACQDEQVEEEIYLLNDTPESQSCSLWVGNITDQVKENQLKDLFKNHGEIHSIRLLSERFCAFVNFKCPAAAARALNALQGREIENTKLLIRYPDKPYRPSTVSYSEAQTKASFLSSKKKGAAKTTECFYWRSTGCSFGDKCRYKHVPENRGVDRRQWKC